MKIKSLLLGSAAALVAMSGAHAADAIVAAEPEPMEYVKVCDAAGATHYFYIPGTETCLSISGFVRYRGDYDFKAKDYIGTFDYELHFDTWNETEYGAAYSKLRLKGSSTNNSDMSAAADGYFGIGGLELGLFDNQWSRFFGYAGYTISEGSYGFNENQYVSYTADLGSAKILGAIDFIASNQAGYVAAVSGTVGDWQAVLGFGYDSLANAFTVKGSVEGEIGPATAKLMAFYANKPNYYNDGGYDGFSLLGTVSVAATDSINIVGTAQWMQSPSTYFLEGGVDWTVADGFLAQAQVNYTSSTDTTAGILRFTRSF